MKNVFFRTCCTILTGITGLAMTMPPQALSGERQITCGSKNFQYHYCRIYTGGRVRLVNQLSHKYCDEGKSWGYDSQGIWVDKGCKADFVVDEGYGRGWNGGYNEGYNSSHDYGSSSRDDDDNNNVGAALGVAAGVAILGALIGGSSNSSGSKDYSSYNDRHRSDVPSWAIGTFQGHNSRDNTEVELTISPSGQVYAIAGGQSFNGTFNGREIIISGNNRFEVERTDNGLTTVQEGNYRNRVQYYRYR
jgi:hypothetical protein